MSDLPNSENSGGLPFGSPDLEEPARRVLSVFLEMGSESLDLHTLFEAGGNDPPSRERVLDAITCLVKTGHLEPRGSDFYSLTNKGKEAAARKPDSPNRA
jgi:hypothetical protein